MAPGRFDKTELQRTWRFALSFNLCGALGMLVMSTDRLLITKLLPINDLTYYAICLTATGPMLVIYIAVSSATFLMTVLSMGKSTKKQFLTTLSIQSSVNDVASSGSPHVILFFWEILYADKILNKLHQLGRPFSPSWRLRY